MRRYVAVLSLVVFCTCLCLAEVEAQEVLTWQDCVKEAQQNHPDLVTAREVVNQFKAQKLTAISATLPQVSTEVSQSLSKKPQSSQTNASFYGITGQQLLKKCKCITI